MRVTQVFTRLCTIIARLLRCTGDWAQLEIGVGVVYEWPIPWFLILFIIGGANLVGSDLYKKLYAYFVAHFKPMTDVRIVIVITRYLADLTAHAES